MIKRFLSGYCEQGPIVFATSSEYAIATLGQLYLRDKSGV